MCIRDSILFSSPVISVPFAEVNIYPNPFTTTTQLGFSLGENAVVNLEIVDIRGKHVSTIIKNGLRDRGNYEAFWNGKDDAGKIVASGTFFCRLLAKYTSGNDQNVVVKIIKY